MAFEFGDEKSENPAPIISSTTTMNRIEVCSVRKQSNISPAVEYGHCLWRRALPGYDGLTACRQEVISVSLVTGNDMSTNPASRGPISLIYCRNRLRKKAYGTGGGIMDKCGEA